jgi:hypothetical protein
VKTTSTWKVAVYFSCKSILFNYGWPMAELKKTPNNFWHYGHLQNDIGQLAPDAYITLWLKILGNHNLENIKLIPSFVYSSNNLLM